MKSCCRAVYTFFLFSYFFDKRRKRSFENYFKIFLQGFEKTNNNEVYECKNLFEPLNRGRADVIRLLSVFVLQTHLAANQGRLELQNDSAARSEATEHSVITIILKKNLEKTARVAPVVTSSQVAGCMEPPPLPHLKSPAASMSAAVFGCQNQHQRAFSVP